VIGSDERKGASNATLSLNLDLFDGFAMDASVATARGQLLRARETRDGLLRNLESEVHRALLGYQEAIERTALANRTVESATENHNLVQQKYNVGSATILDLVDSQVQLQRAQSSLVSALAAIRVAEAALDQVRGRAS
jgi:outer membrane protein TolC